MTLTKDDLRQIGDVVIEVTSPMFEHVVERIDGVERRLDGVETRLDGVEKRLDSVETRLGSLERELRDFKSEVRSKLSALEERIGTVEYTYAYRFDNVEDDIRLLYRLVEKLEHGTKAEKQFAEEAIVEHLPAIHKALVLIAKKHKINLTD